MNRRMLCITLFVVVLPCMAKEFSAPVIKLNFSPLNQSEMVWSANKPFTLSCDGQADIIWKTRLGRHQKYISQNVVTVRNPSAENTGTYRCSYKNQTDLYSEIHMYVKDSVKAFSTTKTTVIVQDEGSDCLLDCLVTNPESTDLSLRMTNGSAVPSEMNYTADPKRGIRILNLQHSFEGDYVCTVKINGVQKTSDVFKINVRRTQHPPWLSLPADRYVRIVGETLRIPCEMKNQGHYYNITWSSSEKLLTTWPSSGFHYTVSWSRSHSWLHRNSSKVLNHEKSVNKCDGVKQCITAVLTIHQVNMSETGNLTCTSHNKAGKSSVTAVLTVVDKPFIKLTPILSSEYKANKTDVEVMQGDIVKLGVEIEAYPEVEWTFWKTPLEKSNHTLEETFHRMHKSNSYISTILLRKVGVQECGHYIFSARSASVNASIVFTVRVYQKPKTVIKRGKGIDTCVATGYPEPRIRWFQCEDTRAMCGYNNTLFVELRANQSTLEQAKDCKPVEVESVLPVTYAKTNSTFECVATNDAGEDRDSFTISYVPGSPSVWSTSVLITVVVCGAFAVVTLWMLILFYKHREAQKYEVQWKIIEVNDGNNYTFIDPTQLPYNKKLEFPRNKLKLGQVLGTGAFGKVVQATAYGLVKDETFTRVAVKMLKPSARLEEKEALMSELKILNYIGAHENIVNLLGACTQEGPMLMITEYCCHGDLLNFLRHRAETFANTFLGLQSLPEDSNVYKNVTVQKSRSARTTGYGSESCNDTQSTPMSKDLCQESCNDGGEDAWTLDNNDLLKFSYQVALGMEFLASKNCIHRDLAARNVLVTDRYVVKICDFGLARDIMNDLNYVVKGNARLPVKWMSPESIFECLYTVQSDVWSYGILLWEIFSLGMSPYPNVVIDAQFYKMIKEGYHMPRPDFAPHDMYTMMKKCWSLEPTQRPTFANIREFIAKLLPKQSSQNNEPMYPEMPRHLTAEAPVSREEVQPLIRNSLT